MSNPYGWPVDPIEPLTYITDRLNNRKPFIYLRFNDGEAYSMFGMKKAPETNGEHVYSESIRWSLMETYAQATYPRDGVLIGSWWYEDPNHPASIEMRCSIERINEGGGSVDLSKWSRGHIWHREELEREGKCLTDELLRFVDAVRNFGVKETCLVASGDAMYDVAKSLNCRFMQISPEDAWTRSPLVPSWFHENDLVIWCAGFPAKPWAWRSWIESDRQSYHIDAGSMFDGLCGRESREWLKRNGSAHSKFYYGEFARYLGIEV